MGIELFIREMMTLTFDDFYYEVTLMLKTFNGYDLFEVL